MRVQVPLAPPRSALLTGCGPRLVPANVHAKNSIADFPSGSWKWGWAGLYKQERKKQRFAGLGSMRARNKEATKGDPGNIDPQALYLPPPQPPQCPSSMISHGL